MWTDENRGRYDRSKLRDPSDLTDPESTSMITVNSTYFIGTNQRLRRGQSIT
jgi:hypothetical protein